MTTQREYVFIPITKSITIIKNDRTTIEIKPEGNQTTQGMQITLEGSDPDHITKIEEGRIYNVLVITGYAVDEKNCRLVPTLDPCDYVKGILVAGKPQQTNNFLTLKLPANKLYLIRKRVKISDDLKIYIPYSSPDANYSTKTQFESISDDKIVDNIISKVFNNIYNNIGQREKVKEDIKELFSYYALKLKLNQ